jgi:hypothetical protein
MKTGQTPLEESRVPEVDREAIEDLRERELERQHRAGYEQKPVQSGEFSDWEDEQAWID